MDDEVAAESGRGADAAGASRLGVTVENLLKDNGFSLQAQAKTLEGDQHPDRDAQFRYISEQVKRQQAAANR